jgi:hypothetical protein
MDALAHLPDPREARGKRYPWTLLVMIIAHSDLGRFWYQCREWGQGFPQEGVPAP